MCPSLRCEPGGAAVQLLSGGSRWTPNRVSLLVIIRSAIAFVLRELLHVPMVMSRFRKVRWGRCDGGSPRTRGWTWLGPHAEVMPDGFDVLS